MALSILISCLPSDDRRRRNPLGSRSDSSHQIVDLQILVRFYTLQPNRLVSPDTLLKRRHGNSFEMATLLCSLLIGNNYGACVVSGYATREVVNNDLKRVDCPHIPQSRSAQVRSHNINWDNPTFEWYHLWISLNRSVKLEKSIRRSHSISTRCEVRSIYRANSSRKSKQND